MYFRLSPEPNTLPLHWAYGDAWEYRHNDDNGEWEMIDNRESGFQVWSEITNVIMTAEGYDRDGVYSAKEYPYLLLIEADNDYVGDSSGEWFSIQPKGVEKMFSIETQSVIDFARLQFASEASEYGYDIEDDKDFEDWLKASEDEIIEWMAANAKQVDPKFIETLEQPEVVYG